MTLIDNPEALGQELKAKETKWLRAAEKKLAMDDPSALEPEQAIRARQAFRLLLADN